MNDLKYHDLFDDGIRQVKVGNPVNNFTDLSFISTSSMKSFRFNSGLLLSSFRIVLLSVLTIDKFFIILTIRCQCLFGKKQSHSPFL